MHTLPHNIYRRTRKRNRRNNTPIQLHRLQLNNNRTIQKDRNENRNRTNNTQKRTWKRSNNRREDRIKEKGVKRVREEENNGGRKEMQYRCEDCGKRVTSERLIFKCPNKRCESYSIRELDRPKKWEEINSPN